MAVAGGPFPPGPGTPPRGPVLSPRGAQPVLVLTVFGGLASVVFVPLSGALVGVFGWRSALLVLALIVGVVCLPVHGLLLRRPPRKPDPGPHTEPIPGASRAEAVRSVSFRWLA